MLGTSSFLTALTNLATTANDDVTYAHTTDACVDFFVKIKEGTSIHDVRTLTEAAWRQSPSDTLKLIFYLLDVREGKGCNLEAITALIWLFRQDPETFRINIGHVGRLGCYRDLMNLVVQTKLTDTQRTELQVSDDVDQRRKGSRPRYVEAGIDAPPFKIDQVKDQMDPVIDAMQRVIVDEICRVLHDDVEKMKKKESVSLLAKWVPSKDSRIDRMTGLNETIAIAFYAAEEDENGAKKKLNNRKRFQLADRLRKECITPLRQYLRVVERDLSAQKWNEIEYENVPAQSMHKNRRVFAKHDAERFTKYLDEVAANKAKIKVGGGLKPYQIVDLMRHAEKSETDKSLAEAQWSAYVNDLTEKGTFSSAMAICDVSGSMESVTSVGTSAMNICLAFGLLIASVAAPPWANHVITFSTEPKCLEITGDTLKKKLNFIQRLPWTMSTDFDRVFDLILDTATSNNIAQDEMVKTLFVFSDMEFNAASSGMQLTTINRIRRKYALAGYQMPQIIFWNLGSSMHVPAKSTDAGIGLISGFSGHMLKLFLSGQLLEGPYPTPADIMREAIDNDRYADIKVAE